MNLIYFLLRSSWGMLAIAMITGFLSGSSSAGLIALISNTASRNIALSVTFLVGAFVGLAIVALVTSIISRVVLAGISQDAILQLRMRLSRQILSSELRHLEQLGNARVLATLTEDVQAVADAVFVIPSLCIDIAIVSGCLLYIGWLSWKVFLMVFGFSIVAIATCQPLLKRAEQLLALVREDQDMLFKHFRTITDGIKELKLNYQRRQAFLQEDLQSTATLFRRHNVRSLILFASVASWGQFLFFFAIGFVLFALPNLLSISPRVLSGYIFTFAYLMMPMNDIINDLPLLSKASVALQKIEMLGLSLTDQAEAPTVPPVSTSSWKHLELRDVTYPYGQEQDESSFILGPINLMFQPGELVFIVGGNGSGKSTLAKLVTGLYIPESGKTFLDGQPISQQNQEWYRQHFSAVFSDFYLFDRLLGLDNINLDTKAQKYLKQLQLNRKVKIENGKLSTTALSQGQRKRLALLTAYLEDRPIYLFDEWAADQDPVFKEVFYTQFLPELKSKGKTVLVITHDDQYFNQADRIIKLDYGQIKYDKQWRK